MYNCFGQALGNAGRRVMAEERRNTVPTLSSKRYLLAYIAFFGFLWSNAMRFNMSVAIVCMVKAPTSPNESSSNDTLAIAVNVDAEKCGLTNSSLHEIKDGEFDWDRKMQGYVLSSFFWGYIITQIPAGWLADLYGSKIVFGVGMSLSSVATILLPVAARGHVYAAIFLRFIIGLGTGVIFPAMHGLWARWAPVYERTKLIAFSYAGTIVGNVFASFMSGVLCEYTGWTSIFYLIGGLSLLWCVIWFGLVFDSPEVHPRISQIEKSFILSHTSRTNQKKDQVIPWLSFLKSSALWAILVAHVCGSWGSYTMMTSLPTYMKDVLYFDMKQNGIFNALPYVTMFIASIGCGVFADFMRTKFSTTSVRKVLQVLGFVVPAAFLIGTGYLGCTQRMFAVTLLVIAVTFSALDRCGYLVNHVDIAPRYAGIFMGITNTCATIAGMLAPITVGNITQDRSQESWRKVFYICAVFYAFGTIIYAIFAKGEEEKWAKIEELSDPKSTELEPL